MKLRIAILAVCASTFVLAHADLSLAAECKAGFAQAVGAAKPKCNVVQKAFHKKVEKQNIAGKDSAVDKGIKKVSNTSGKAVDGMMKPIKR